jgi:hypothetical protein
MGLEVAICDIKANQKSGPDASLSASIWQTPKVVNVTGGLVLAPESQRISYDGQQVGFGTTGKA